MSFLKILPVELWEPVHTSLSMKVVFNMPCAAEIVMAKMVDGNTLVRMSDQGLVELGFQSEIDIVKMRLELENMKHISLEASQKLKRAGSTEHSYALKYGRLKMHIVNLDFHMRWIFPLAPLIIAFVTYWSLVCNGSRGGSMVEMDTA